MELSQSNAFTNLSLNIYLKILENNYFLIFKRKLYEISIENQKSRSATKSVVLWFIFIMWEDGGKTPGS